MSDQLKQIDSFNEEFVPPHQKTFSSANIEISLHYQAKADFTLHRIDLWTGPFLEESTGDSSSQMPMLLSVFVRADDNASPSTQLAGGSLELQEGVGWQSVYLDIPLEIKKSTVYWLCYFVGIPGFEADSIKVGRGKAEEIILPPESNFRFRSPSIPETEISEKYTFTVRSVKMYHTKDGQNWQGPSRHFPLMRIYGLPVLTPENELFELWHDLSLDQQETILRVAYNFLDEVAFDSFADDPTTSEDLAAIKEAKRAYQAGETLNFDEVMADLKEIERV